jgi:predicted aldo/keto reductase-like oxidoreductase
MPCPQGVDIPGNLSIYNEGYVYGRPEFARRHYEWWKNSWQDPDGGLDHDIRAVKCIQCGACEKKCPQSIQISRWMPGIHKALAENGPYITKLE